jgi:hypothetical protein
MYPKTQLELEEGRLLEAAREGYQSRASEDIHQRRFQALRNVYDAMNKGWPNFGSGPKYGLKEAKDWVDTHWTQIAPDVHVTLYNADESLTKEGRYLEMKVENKLKLLLEELTKWGELTVNEAVSLIHSSVGIVGARMVLENRRKERGSKPTLGSH